MPEIRLKGFEGDWEERILGDISKSYSGGTPTASNKNYYGGNIPFIRSGEINADKTELSLTEEGFKNSAAKKVKEGDILYALYGATSGEVAISKINGVINQAILAIIPDIKYNAEFISFYLRNRKKHIVDTYLQGGQGNLSGQIVKGLTLLFPKKNEQDTIATFFHRINSLITTKEQEIEKLKNLKNAFLIKMFVKQ